MEGFSSPCDLSIASHWTACSGVGGCDGDGDQREPYTEGKARGCSVGDQREPYTEGQARGCSVGDQREPTVAGFQDRFTVSKADKTGQRETRVDQQSSAPLGIVLSSGLVPISLAWAPRCTKCVPRDELPA